MTLSQVPSIMHEKLIYKDYIIFETENYSLAASAAIEIAESAEPYR